MSTYSGNRGSNRTSNLELLERELSLKQLQINRLLEVTQAINNNLAADALFKIYRSILGWEMKIDKMALFIRDEEEWMCTTGIGFDKSQPLDFIGYELLKYDRMTNLLDSKHPIIGQFAIIIPVYHLIYLLNYFLMLDELGFSFVHTQNPCERPGLLAHKLKSEKSVS